MVHPLSFRGLHPSQVLESQRKSLQRVSESCKYDNPGLMYLMVLIHSQVCKLPQLEILDLSRNKLSRIPEDIKTMKTLRVLSLLNNNLGDIPSFVGSLEALRILKITGNPLKPNLKRIVEGNDGSSSPSLTTLADNEKDAHLTKKIKKYLKSEVVSKESGEESR